MMSKALTLSQQQYRTIDKRREAHVRGKQIFYLGGRSKRIQETRVRQCHIVKIKDEANLEIIEAHLYYKEKRTGWGEEFLNHFKAADIFNHYQGEQEEKLVTLQLPIVYRWRPKEPSELE